MRRRKRRRRKGFHCKLLDGCWRLGEVVEVQAARYGAAYGPEMKDNALFCAIDAAAESGHY